MGNGNKPFVLMGNRKSRDFVHFDMFVPFGSQQTQINGNREEVGWSDSSVSHGRVVLNMPTA